MRRPCLAALLLATSPALGQTCDGPIGPIETCLVGAWIGTSDMPERFEAFAQSFPSTLAVSASNFGQPSAMIIYEDGFFETLPTGAVAYIQTEIGDGDMAEIDMNFQTTTAAGWLTAVSGSLLMCHMPGSGTGIGQATYTTPDGSGTAVLAPPPDASGEIPPMTFTCSGDTMTQVVVAGPLGAITYTFQRIDRDALPEEFQTRVEERYAPAE